jgi:hypothetical protein
MAVKEKEAEVLSSCLKTLSAFGVFAWRNNNMGVRRERAGQSFYTFNGVRGVSDIIGVLPRSFGKLEGHILCVECKATGKLKTQSPEQKAFQCEIEAAGGEYLLVDSYEMIIAWLEKQKAVKK